MNFSLILVAGGVGKRMGGNVPKQYLLLNKQPIIIHTLRKFLSWNPNIELVLVISEAMENEVHRIMESYLPNQAYKVTFGGKERFHSVQNGLKKCTGDIIGIHDAVRPLVNQQTIENCFNMATNGNAVPSIALTESLRRKTADGSQIVDRNNMLIVQTPQCFLATQIKAAYNTEYHTHFTDDASVAEHARHSIQLVEGNRENIKITTPEDLIFAQLFLDKK